MAKIFFVIVVLCLALANCDLVIKHEMTVEDLYGHRHLNDMLANTLNQKDSYMLGLSDYQAHWTYKGFHATKKQFHKAHAFIKPEAGHEFELVKEELEAETLMDTYGKWLTFVSIPASKDGKTYPRVVLMKWDCDKRRYEVMILNTKTPLASSLQKSHLVRFSSELGFEANEPTLIAEIPSADAQHAYALARMVMISAYERVAFMRGVDKKDHMAQEHFKLWKSPKHQLGIGPLAVIVIAALCVQIASAIWGFLCQLFGTKVKYELVAEIKGRGFRNFSLSAVYRKHFDIPQRNIERYTTLLAKIVTDDHPNKQKQETMRANIYNSLFMDRNQAMVTDGIIDTGNGSEDRFFTLASHLSEDGAYYNMVSMNMKTTFKLAPDIQVYKKSTSWVGGIYAEVEYELKEVPREVTEDDIKAISGFNVALAMKIFTDNLNAPGYKIPNYPDF